MSYSDLYFILSNFGKGIYKSLFLCDSATAVSLDD